MNATIRTLRREIDRLDTDFLKILAQRFQLVEELSVLKKEKGLAITQSQRETEMLLIRTKMGDRLKISPVFIQKLFRLIWQESKKLQRSEQRASKKKLTQRSKEL